MTEIAPLARIYLPPRPATQSGKGRSGEWVLRFAPTEKLRLDPLMGWAGSGDTMKQVYLTFPTKEAAIAYCEARDISYEVEPPASPAPIKPKVYADNFRYGRAENWSH
ncbi:ETC complex I subunit [Sabulicella rubraurantiaca]|uniref:ETC complex I subunit n=1 Tax=Sabulicella rubraurantiaca TaxID=2811429 RepID=UPI001A97A4DF|nr:ETC complex I subunit [Sabulicella rubraurantiaca]